MTAALALLALCAPASDQEERPGTLPPMMEFADRTAVLGATDGVLFAPTYGGMLLTTIRGDVTYAHTSDSGLLVNLRTGELTDVGAADILARQILSPSAVFVRCYRSELARAGKHSPGLPVGWVHNYDAIIKLPEGEERWEPFTLTYPNKAQELVTPQLGPDGRLTGKGLTLSNQTYRVTLAPGPKTNTYEWVRVDWPNSRAHWIFSPHASGPMVLRAIGEEGIHGGEIRLGYLPDRTLGNVTFPAQSLTLLTFAYSGGLLASAASREGASVGYTYARVGADTVLYKVTGPEAGHDSYVYSYAQGMPYPALSQIAVPDGTGWSKSTVEYARGRVSAVQSASGNRQRVGPTG